MANPGQSNPPGHVSHPDQGMDIGMIPRDPEANSDQVDDLYQARDRGQTDDSERIGTGGAGSVVESRDSVLDDEAVQTLEHGGYGGEQEYAE